MIKEGGFLMKASDFIIHLQEMIEIHGDLPLALTEFNKNAQSYAFIEIGAIEGVVELEEDEYLFDENDVVSKERKVFLID